VIYKSLTYIKAYSPRGQNNLIKWDVLPLLHNRNLFTLISNTRE